MSFYPTDRLALFIDGANLHGAARALGFDIDFRKLLEEFRRRGVLVRASYYTMLTEEQDFSPLRPLVDWLDYNGFTVVTKTAKEFTDREGRRRRSGSIEVELAVDMLEAAGRLDHIVLASGDSAYCHAVAAVQRRGVRVSVISTLRSTPPMASDDLRRQADAFIELADLADMIGRPRNDYRGEPRGDRLPRFVTGGRDEADD